jgi:hypothetical protein
VFHKVRLNQGKDFFGSVSDFKIVPHTNREYRGVDWVENRLLPDLSVISEVQWPHLCPVLAIEDEGVMSFPQKEFLWDMKFN